MKSMAKAQSSKNNNYSSTQETGVVYELITSHSPQTTLKYIEKTTFQDI